MVSFYPGQNTSGIWGLVGQKKTTGGPKEDHWWAKRRPLVGQKKTTGRQKKTTSGPKEDHWSPKEDH